MYSTILKAGAICAIISSLLAPCAAFAAEGTAYNAAVSSINGFALRAAVLLGKQPGDFFFSPFSVVPALGMVYAGANGGTAAEIERAMSMSRDIHKSLGELTRDLTANLDGKEGRALLTSANRVWITDGLKLKPEFNSILLKDYHSTAAKADFKGNPEGAKNDINSWVELHTNNRIRNLIRQIQPDTRMILTNAVYFMGEWEKPFDKKRTEPKPFHVSKSEEKDVPMMAKKANMLYGEADDMKLLRLPYKGRLSMLLALPAASGWDDGEEAANKALSLLAGEDGLAAFARWRGGLSEHSVDLWLPKFKTERRYELKDILSSLGIKLAFSDGADFSGMTDGEKLKIDSVIHQTFIEVDEKKTEAAAATSITMVKATAIAPRKLPEAEFHADRPFIYFIVDDATNAILFMGRQAFTD